MTALSPAKLLEDLAHCGTRTAFDLPWAYFRFQLNCRSLLLTITLNVSISSHAM